jgi:opacity protein-like surface antigen
MAGRWTWRVLAGALVVLGLPAGVVAQSREFVSVQGSGAVVFPTKDYGEGLESGAKLGFEAQVRFTFSRFSVGVGYQDSEVFKGDPDVADLNASIVAGFVEPRYVVAVLGDRFAPYVAARLGYGSLQVRGDVERSEDSFTYGAGGGVMIAIVPRLSADLGAQYFRADFGDSGAGYFLLRAGLSVGLF